MKKPQFKSDVAFVLGKAAQHCKSIREIFLALNKDSTKIEEAICDIEGEINMQIDGLQGQS